MFSCACTRSGALTLETLDDDDNDADAIGRARSISIGAQTAADKKTRPIEIGNQFSVKMCHQLGKWKRLTTLD